MAATHVALIRGINVGGNNAVSMAALRAGLEADGFADVRTYINSGNVVLDAGKSSTAAVNKAVEAVLLRDFAVKTVVVTVTADALRRVVADAPAGFGADTEEFKHDVVFLSESLDTQETFAAVRLKEGIDEAWAGEQALYFRRLSSRITGSYMGKIVALPQYKHMTIRNWRTTTTLAGMLDDTALDD